MRDSATGYSRSLAQWTLLSLSLLLQHTKCYVSGRTIAFDTWTKALETISYFLITYSSDVYTCFDPKSLRSLIDTLSVEFDGHSYIIRDLACVLLVYFCTVPSQCPHTHVIMLSVRNSKSSGCQGYVVLDFLYIFF